MPSKSVWIDNGSDPNYALLAKYNIKVLFFDPRDPRVTASYLDSVKAQGGIEQCGIYTVWNWQPEFSDPVKYAEWTDQQLLRINWAGNPWVFLDIEKGNGVNDQNFVSYAISCLTRWRQLRPSRTTYWTLEGMQGGLFSGNQANQIESKNVRTYPQFFAGNMTPHTECCVIDLQEVGFTKIDGMYDGSLIPNIWRGCAFTQGRLKP